MDDPDPILRSCQFRHKS